MRRRQNRGRGRGWGRGQRHQARQGRPWRHHYDRVCENPEEYRDHVREPIDEDALARLGRTHLTHIHVPSIPVPGLGTLEKKLICWVCEHTGAPNPFHALEKLTGDCLELQRAERAWEAAYQEVEAVAASIRTAAQPLRAAWSGPQAERFGAAVDSYLAGLDALAGCMRTTWDCLKAVRSEAQLAEGTVQMLINLLLGSLGGLVVAELVTAGSVTPVAAAQVQMELAYVAKKIATIGGKLSALFSDVIKVLDAVRGFKRIEAMRFVFDLAPGITSAL